jgi:hypothetical protein
VIGPTKVAGACRSGSVETNRVLAYIAGKYICNKFLAGFRTEPIGTKYRHIKSCISVFTGTAG